MDQCKNKVNFYFDIISYLGPTLSMIFCITIDYKEYNILVQ